jgi:hypothetical protein
MLVAAGMQCNRNGRRKNIGEGRERPAEACLFSSSAISSRIVG